VGDMYREICSWESLRLAHRKASRGKRVGRSGRAGAGGPDFGQRGRGPKRRIPGGRTAPPGYPLNVENALFKSVWATEIGGISEGRLFQDGYGGDL